MPPFHNWVPVGQQNLRRVGRPGVIREVAYGRPRSGALRLGPRHRLILPARLPVPIPAAIIIRRARLDQLHAPARQRGVGLTDDDRLSRFGRCGGRWRRGNGDRDLDLDDPDHFPLDDIIRQAADVAAPVMPAEAGRRVHPAGWPLLGHGPAGGEDNETGRSRAEAKTMKRLHDGWF